MACCYCVVLTSEGPYPARKLHPGHSLHGYQLEVSLDKATTTLALSHRRRVSKGDAIAREIFGLRLAAAAVRPLPQI